jgi:hypothetical protein
LEEWKNKNKSIFGKKMKDWWRYYGSSLPPFAVPILVLWVRLEKK